MNTTKQFLRPKSWLIGKMENLEIFIKYYSTININTLVISIGKFEGDLGFILAVGVFAWDFRALSRDWPSLFASVSSST